MRYAVALVGLLGACAAPPEPPKPADTEERRVVWIRDAAIMFRTCGLDANGCHRLRDGVHYIYTRAAREVYDDALHCTAGHELRHVFEGKFHGTEPRVVNMNTWRFSDGITK